MQEPSYKSRHTPCIMSKCLRSRLSLVFRTSSATLPCCTLNTLLLSLCNIKLLPIFNVLHLAFLLSFFPFCNFYFSAVCGKIAEFFTATSVARQGSSPTYDCMPSDDWLPAISRHQSDFFISPCLACRP